VPRSSARLHFGPLYRTRVANKGETCAYLTTCGPAPHLPRSSTGLSAQAHVVAQASSSCLKGDAARAPSRRRLTRAAPRRGLTWMTKEGLRKPNYWGSLTQASTCRVGSFRGEEVHAPFSALLPMVHPNDIVFGGWDISGLNLAEAMERAQARPLPLPSWLEAGHH
jgi:hypothetical protein